MHRKKKYFIVFTMHIAIKLGWGVRAVSAWSGEGGFKHFHLSHMHESLNNLYSVSSGLNRNNINAVRWSKQTAVIRSGEGIT